MIDSQGRSLAGLVTARRSTRRPILLLILSLFAIGLGDWQELTPSMPTREAPPVAVPVKPLPTPAEIVKAADEAVRGGWPFYMTVDPRTPLKDLLPVPPKIRPVAPSLGGDDLTRVPEVDFQEPLTSKKVVQQRLAVAFQVACIKHLDAREPQGFVKALRDARPDLAGLPFVLGDDCRRDKEWCVQFVKELSLLRQDQGYGRTLDSLATPLGSEEPVDPKDFWNSYERHWGRISVRVAALMQVVAVEPSKLRPGLVKYLSTVSDTAATQALARLAIYSSEDEIRRAAVEALTGRVECDYTDILLQGLRYPWPAAARRAAQALVNLRRCGLVPQLVDLLDEPDPRAPVVKDIGGKQVAFARELVRVNHHRNCLLCHAPLEEGGIFRSSMKERIPMPGESLSAETGLSDNPKSPMIQFDVTYLRQDFSVRQPVANANPWPEMQRFDFLVRTRQLTDAEAASYREKFASPEPGRPSPYREAALAALRGLTGKDTEPTAAAWRRLLDLPAKQRTATP